MPHKVYPILVRDKFKVRSLPLYSLVLVCDWTERFGRLKGLRAIAALQQSRTGKPKDIESQSPALMYQKLLGNGDGEGLEAPVD